MNESQKHLSHLDEQGHARMVHVGDKAVTERTATATATVQMQPTTFSMIVDQTHPKGDVLACARIAGIMAAKKTSELIPLCHPIMLSSVKVDFEMDPDEAVIHIHSVCKINAQTGVEMEALTAVSVAALTLYDMCKAVDRGMKIASTHLVEKKGGKSGHWRNKR